MANFEKIGQYKIFFNEMYFLAYAGGTRDLAAGEKKEWDKTLYLPELLRVKEQGKIDLKNNPNVVPLRGRDLLAFIKELQFIPLFDKFFEKTHVLQLSDAIVYESIKQRSYDVALKS